MRRPKPYYRKQRDCWYVQIGKKQINLGKDKKVAWDQYHKIMAGMEVPIGDCLRVPDVINAYWNHHCLKLADTTRDRRKPILTSFGKWAAGMSVNQLTPFQVIHWLDERYPKAKDTYKNTLLTAIKGAFEWAEGVGMIKANPIRKLKKPRPKVRQEFLPRVRWQEVIDAATDQQFRDYLIFALTTGYRPQETMRIEARHFTGERIEFPPEEAKGREDNRVILLPGESRAIVERLVVQWPEGPIFRNRYGGAWTRYSIRDRFDRLKVLLKEPKLCATVLRHSYCHYRLSSGQPDHVVATLMGHKDTRMVQQRYGHLSKATEFLANEAHKYA